MQLKAQPPPVGPRLRDRLMGCNSADVAVRVRNGLAVMCVIMRLAMQAFSQHLVNANV